MIEYNQDRSAILLPYLVLASLMWLTKSCAVKDLKRENDELRGKSQIERIVIEDSKVYAVNSLGQTNYFQYNGKWYEPTTNHIIKATK